MKCSKCDVETEYKEVEYTRGYHSKVFKVKWNSHVCPNCGLRLTTPEEMIRFAKELEKQEEAAEMSVKTDLCPNCKKLRCYSGKYDAYYCSYCKIWLEKNCGDETCVYCDKRPTVEEMITHNFKEEARR